MVHGAGEEPHGGGGAQAEAEAAEALAAGTAATAASGAWATALKASPPMLHAIDDMGAAEGGNRGTAHLVVEAAEALGLRPLLTLHEGDAYEMADTLLSSSTTSTTATASGASGGSCVGSGASASGSDELLLDMLWLDFGLGGGRRIEAFLDAWWPQLRPGGYLIMHSTLTNAVTRAWLEKQRQRARPGGGGTLEPNAQTPSAPQAHAAGLSSINENGDAESAGGGGGGGGGDGGGREASSASSSKPRGHLGAFESLSLLEPHKMYQNACSVFQKRDGGWAEPVLTSYP